MQDEVISTTSPSTEIPIIMTGHSDIDTELKRKCPDWSNSFRKQYLSKCKFWLNQVKLWEANLLPNSPHSLYTCSINTKCDGWGDRASGMLSMFYRALFTSSQFRIHSHDSLHKLFKNSNTLRIVNVVLFIVGFFSIFISFILFVISGSSLGFISFITFITLRGYCKLSFSSSRRSS